MELRFKGQFNRDIDIANHELLEQVWKAIQNVQTAKTVSQIKQLKKLRAYETYYRIKIADNYRIGVVIRKEVVWFVRFGHRGNFYKGFP